MTTYKPGVFYHFGVDFTYKATSHNLVFFF